jgi:tetratricopeptide (TPR) repeat protein
MDIEALWDYSDPAGSEGRFRAALTTLPPSRKDAKLEILTQMARTYSLRKRFDEAHALLNDVWIHEKTMGAAPRVRYLLERGRTYNSRNVDDDREKARLLFIEAWEVGTEAELRGLAVDAAHMVAITYSGTAEVEKAIAWNRQGLELARRSEKDAKAQKDAKVQALIPALLNNMGWDLHGTGQYADALVIFEEALTEYEACGKIQAIQIAKWSVARCLRSLGLYEKALAIQYALESEHNAAGTRDRYVYEEIAENLNALGTPEDAAPYRQRADEAFGR